MEAREPKASIAGAFLELLVVANRRQSLPFLFHSKGVVIVLLTSSSSFFVICVTIILGSSLIGSNKDVNGRFIRSHRRGKESAARNAVCLLRPIFSF